MKQGILKIKNKGRRELKVKGKPLSIPKEFDTSHLAKGSYDCELVIENNKVIKILIDKKEVPKDSQIIERKIAKTKAKEAQEKADKEAKALEKRYGDKFKNDLFQKCQDEEGSTEYQVFAPSDTLKIKIASYQAENFALKLNKFATSGQSKKEGKFIFYKQNIKTANNELTPFFGHFPFEDIIQKQKEQVKLITPQHKCWIQSTNGRMVTGLGGASVYETSMTLHHIYGIPYIPASSIKGVVRSWIIQQIIYPNLLEEDKTFEQLEPKEQNKKLEKAAMQGNVFAAIFGTDDNASDSKAHRGNIIFFDAFPTSEPSIEVDIMTPHYSDYYGDTDNKKQKAPTDTESPIPIPFLTVAKDTKFQFIIGKQKGGADLKLKEEIKNSPLITKSNNKLDENSDLIAITTYWLKQALSQHGIGAKTAVGYGYFNEKEEKCSST